MAKIAAPLPQGWPQCGTYVRRPNPLYAVKLDAPCQLDISSSGLGLPIGLVAYAEGEIGDWLVTDPDSGRQQIVKDAEFRAEYQPAGM